MRASQFLCLARLLAASLCSLLLTGCPQLLRDGFNIVGSDTDAGEVGLTKDAGTDDDDAGSGGRDGYDEGVGGSSNGVGGTMSNDGTGGIANIGGSGGSTRSGGLHETGAFTTVEIVDGLNVPGDLWGPSLNADNSSLYFSVWDSSADRIWVASRADRRARFSYATQVQIQGVCGIQSSPFLSVRKG